MKWAIDTQCQNELRLVTVAEVSGIAYRPRHMLTFDQDYRVINSIQTKPKHFKHKFTFTINPSEKFPKGV